MSGRHYSFSGELNVYHQESMSKLIENITSINIVKDTFDMSLSNYVIVSNMNIKKMSLSRLKNPFSKCQLYKGEKLFSEDFLCKTAATDIQYIFDRSSI